MQVICVVNRVICGPVSAGLIPQKVGVSPGETGGARKTGVPRTKIFTMYWTIIVR